MNKRQRLGNHISIRLGMEVKTDMRDLRVSANKEKIILGAITAVALFSVGIGLASVLSDNKNYENNWNNVVDLGDGSDDVADASQPFGATYDEYDSDTWSGMQSGASEDDDGGMAVSNSHAGVAGYTASEEQTTKGCETSNVSETAQDVAVGAEVNPLRAYTFSQTSTLAWPVYGSVVMNYSVDSTVLHKTLGVYKTNPAISISAAIGTEVEAAASGIVQSVYESEETGTTMVIAVGDGYMTTYGLLDNVAVSVGEAVTDGQVLGTVGAPTAYYLEEGPNVYFAVTKDGEPVDPMDFLK